MTFTLTVEHEIIGGETVVETFEGVEMFQNPPMTNNLHITYVDDRDEDKLSYGKVVSGKDDTSHDNTD